MMHTDKLFFFVLVLPFCLGGIGTQTVQAQGNCEDYDSNKKFRFGDQCKNAAGDAAVNYSDAAGLDGKYVAIGIDGGTGYVDYEWEPPSNLEKIDITIRASIKDDSAGELKIKYWNGSDYVDADIKNNDSYSEKDYVKIEITKQKKEIIGNGYFAMQFITNDGWWIDQVEADWTEANPQLATLNLRVENVEGGTDEVPGDNGEVTLFDENGTQVKDPWRTDATGEVTFTDLDPTEDYRAEVYHDPDDSPFGAREYWASVPGIAVDPGETRDLTIVRSKPFLSTFQAVQSGEKVTGGSVTAGEEVTIRAQIHNPSDGETADVRPRVAVQNEQGEEVFDEKGDYERVAEGYKSTLYRFSWTPQEAGTYYRGYEVQIDEGGDQVTDSAPFKTRLVTAEEPPKAEIKLRVENVDTEGASTTVPRDNGEVSLFDENGAQIRDTEPTDAVGDGTGAGQVIFTGLEAPKSYEARVYHDNENSPLGITEYWGRKTGISVQSGKTAEVDFSREQPYFQDLKVLNSDGENVTTETVRAGTPLTVKITVKNDGAAQEVTPRLVLDDNRDDSDGFLYDKTRPPEVVAGDGNTKTFSFSWTPEETGDVYRTYVINGIVPDEDGGSRSDPTGSGGWWDQPLVNVEKENKAPDVAAAALEGLPSSMYPGRTYTISALYRDENGVSDLDHVDLLLDHPTDQTIHLIKTVAGENRVESGQDYANLKKTSTKKIDETTLEVDWTLTFTNNTDDPSTDWTAVEDRGQGISFRVKATDESGETAGEESSVKALYRNYGTTVITHGLQFGPDPLEYISAPLSELAFEQYDDRLSRWLRDMACFIRKKAGRGKIRIYDKDSGEFEPVEELDLTDPFYRHFDEPGSRFCPQLKGSSNQLVAKPDESSGGEVILLFNWTKDSNDRGRGYSESAASALFASLNRRDIDEKKKPIEPLHLIGHSRGTTVMSETAGRLLQSGFSVDQVTYLDTHDWGFGPQNVADGQILHSQEVNPSIASSLTSTVPDWTPLVDGIRNSGAVAWEGIDWVESYYQRNEVWDFGTNRSPPREDADPGMNRYQIGNCAPSFLNGRPVEGAYSQEWSGQVEKKLDESEDCDLGHSGVYREYIRSIEGTSDAAGGYKFSRIGGYPHKRPDEDREGSTTEPKWNVESARQGIVNGDFERGDATEIPRWCRRPEGCIPGWTHHGGGGTVGRAKAELRERPNGNQVLVIGLTDIAEQGLFPTRSVRRSDRFFVPENAKRIQLEYRIDPDPVEDPAPDRFHVDLGRKGDGFSEEYRAFEESDTYQSAEIPLTASEKGSVQQLRLRVTNEQEEVDTQVYVDDVRFIMPDADPTIAFTPNDREIRVGGEPLKYDLQSIFNGPEGESLQYNVSSSSPTVATASQENGSLVISPGTIGGEATISLTATAGPGQSAETSFKVTVLDTPLPDPKITNRNDPPAEVQPGGELSLSLEVTNDGGLSTYGSISASFPGYDQPGDAEQVQPGSSISEGDEPGYVERPSGQPIFKRGGEEITADYLLAEYADNDWESGETNTLDLQVTAPEEGGTFNVYVRTTLSSGGETVTVPGENSEAQTATDQQGYRVFKIPVQVTSDPGTPIVENPVDDQTLLVTQENEFTKDLGPVFKDPNGDDLSYEVSVSDQNSEKEIVSVEILSSTLVLDPGSAGEATVDVTAKDGTGKSATVSFAVTVENPAPSLAAISPSEGAQGKTISATLKGSGFVGEVSTIDVSGSGVSVDQTTVNSASEIDVTFSVADAASTGDREVTVSNSSPGGGTTDASSFSVIERSLRRTLSVGQGWNMVGMPVQAGASGEKGLGAALPSGCESPYRWRPAQGAYQELGSGEALSPGGGAWTFCESSGTAEISGAAAPDKTAEVEAGWNQVGPFEADIAPGEVRQDPSGILQAGTWFRWDPGQGQYANPSMLEPGEGYWVFATGSGTLDFSGGGSKQATATVAASAQAGETSARGMSARGEPNGALTLQVTDQAGRRAEVHLVGELNEEGRWRRPPVAPGGDFRVSFGKGLIAAERKEGQMHSIQLSGAKYPVELRLEGGGGGGLEGRGGERQEGGESGATRHVLRVETPGRTIRLTPGAPGARLEAAARELKIGAEAVPEEVILQEPYPNPARGPVTLQYALPERREVRIAVYDVLGREVATLANGEKEAGRHRAILEASRLPSGTYFARMQAGSFTKTRRVTIVK
ncbi:T9SS type A sorting domain-containing protein [Salinibacter ruber]|uniref:Secretion system C-terminal sorting domain-containing protein n=1 Tax=Salinibacter ruber TaxID=146919 RepID=A0A9X3AAF8_9BACT|nr:T9SS type A sorting domain-containing protein [Salinibacter ruber]MCS4122861.1 hypothetical protein [Salinibacter ruber]